MSVRRWSLAGGLIAVGLFVPGLRGVRAAEGDVIWSRSYNGSAWYSWDIGNSVGLDSTGNIIVGAQVVESSNNEWIWVRKYDGEGGVLWTFTAAGTFLTAGTYVAVDRQDAIYVASSWWTNTTTGVDLWLAKLSPSGVLLWATTWNDASNFNNMGQGIALDDNDNVFIVGSTEQLAFNDVNGLVLLRYSALGDLTWSVTLAGAQGRGLALGPGGAVYVAGWAEGAPAVHPLAVGEKTNIFVARYQAGGGLVWSRTFNFPSNDFTVGSVDVGYGVAVAPDGSVIFCGAEDSQVGGDLWWVRRYTADGEMVWNRDFKVGRDKVKGVPYVIAPDVDGTLLLAGEIEEVDGFAMAIRKYDLAGNLLWTRRYPTYDDFSINAIHALLVRPGVLVAVGEEGRWLTDDFANVWVMKLVGTQPLPPPPVAPALPAGRVVVYPNPASLRMGVPIRFANVEPGSVVTIRSLAGEEIASVTADPAGVSSWSGENKDGTKVAPGVYLYRAVSNGKRATGKFVIEP